ncbi:hypothetical protein C8R44DRAFT_865390 [Mycena epipterygia]|nr:hypothetical protein C8R44DRAFT_865390 [Mycena epipterygia]
MEWVVTVIRAFEGFIYFHNGMDAAVFFNDNAQITETLADSFLALSLVIGDSMIIYRLWVVWSFNKKVIILPIMSLMGLLISLIITVQATVHLESIALDTGLTPITVFTMVTNVYCTGMLAWEIWRISRDCQPVGGMNLRDFLAIVVESAAIYTFVLTRSSSFADVNSNLQYGAVEPIAPLVGLTNALIHVRVGLGRTIEQLSKSSAGGSTLATAPIRFVPRPAGTMSGDENMIKMTDL